MTQRFFAAVTTVLMLGSLAPARAQTTPPADAPGASAAMPTVQYRGDAGHTGYTSEAMPTPLSLLWRHTTAQAPGSAASPVTAAGVTYFGCGTRVYAVNAADGTLRWQFPVAGDAAARFGTTPTLVNGFLYIGADDDRLYKFNAATGDVVWAKKVDGPIRSSAVVDGGRVYFGSADNHLYALSADTGDRVWAFEAGSSITTAPIVYSGQVVFACTDNLVYSISAASGKVSWTQRLPSDPSVSPPVSANGVLYVGAGDTLYALAAHGGAVRWATRLPALLANTPTVGDGSVYVATEDRKVYALTTERGRRRWSADLAYSTSAPGLLAGSTLLIAAQHGVVHAFDTQTGLLKWQYVVGASATATQVKYATTDINSAPAWADKTLYVLSDDGTLSAFRADAVDMVPPQAENVSPLPGSVIGGVRIPYYASLVDMGTGINPATVKLSIDNVPIALAKYDAGRSAVYVDLSNDTRGDANRPLPDGAHQMLLQAQDWKGNALSRTWGFTVDNRFDPPGTPAASADDPNLTPSGPPTVGGGIGVAMTPVPGGSANTGPGSTDRFGGVGGGPPPPPPMDLPTTGGGGPAPPPAPTGTPPPTAPAPTPPTGPGPPPVPL